MARPLEGCRVIELTHIMAGPVCGLMLADMGADVIKVERPNGDDTRRTVPPEINGESAAYMMMNRNKRGISLDLKQPEALQALKNLLKDADVVIENFRKGTMERLGIGYEEVRKTNPGIIYTSLSGFGRTGPYADRGGFDLIAQGMSGLMSCTGVGPGQPPVKVAAPISDITAGILAAMGTAAAYAHKLKTGEGQCVDTSLFEAAITQTYWQSAIAFATGINPQPMGSAHPLNAPYQAFRTSDGWINIGAANQSNWERFVKLIDAEHLAEDPRYVTNADRMANREALAAELDAILCKRSTQEWLDVMEGGGMPAGPVYTITEMQNDPQAVARDMVPELDHPKAGRMQTLGMPVKFSDAADTPRRPAPLLGQHTREILAEAGLDATQIEALVSAGAAIEPK
ncbi:CaiB/BaiF CoA transferase family protein [Tepidamorphus sp. 3E244]|uniref:CaiB/BaiF CoA transferase family protein n=1 Tax=Tepidamorphus sp. 3E244 TaxID=3385498 RepID=UPI0038FCD627